MTLKEKAELIFYKDIYATQTTGIVIEEVAENYAKCSLRIESRHLNAVQTVMGGVIYTLADFCFAIASNLTEQNVVTLNSQINYLATPKGEVLVGEASCVKEGRSICTYRMDVKDERDNLVAFVITTGLRLQKRECSSISP